MSGSLNLTVSSPAQSFTEPLGLAEVKGYLNIPARSPSDSLEDALLESYITGARVQAEYAQNRDLVLKQWDLSLDYWCDEPIKLRPNLVSVTLVKYRDSNGTYTTLAENTDYIVVTTRHPGVILPPGSNGSWASFTPWPADSILIRFISGIGASDLFWSNEGRLLKPGMLLLISAWFHNRLPYETGQSVIAEYPYGIRDCLLAGAIDKVF